MLSSRHLALLLLGTALLLAFAASCSSFTSPSTPDALKPVAETYETLREQHIDRGTTSEEQLIEAAIRGMLEALDDPYASYFPPDAYAIVNNFSGQFDGIGAEVTIRNRQFIILAPLPDSPAMQAGIRPGDLVLSVDGQSLEGKTLAESVLMIRGPEGTPVILEIVHEGSISPIEITIVRDTIVETSVTSQQLEPGIGYVSISVFEEPTAAQLIEALEQLQTEEVTGLVLDLRNNGGGLLSSAVDVASQFLDDGLVLSSVEADGTTEEFLVEPGGVATDIPMVVLVNGFTASAAEIVAGALRDHDRAILVGTRTFGKGSINLLTPLSGGAGFYFTNSRWITPAGQLIEGQGLTPEVLVGTQNVLPYTVEVLNLLRMVPPLCNAYREAREDLDRRPDIAEALEQLCITTTSPPEVGGDADLQLEGALEVLKSQRLQS